MKKSFYKYINAFFVALAVGTLYADTLFELIPSVSFNMIEIEWNKFERFQIIDKSFKSEFSFQYQSTNTLNDHTNQTKPRISLFIWQMVILITSELHKIR